eukprot:1148766-Pelagomonas_calceolata.AAC.5
MAIRRAVLVFWSACCQLSHALLVPARPWREHPDVSDCMCLQMLLLDRAIKLAAEQDEPPEMNFVRKHALQQVRMWGVCLPECKMLGTRRRLRTLQLSRRHLGAPSMHL